MTDKMREEFEAVISGPPYHQSVERFDGDSAWSDCYKHLPVHLAWEMWQESRAALLVRLPKTYGFASIDADPELYEYNRAVKECRESILSAGVRVKP